MTDRQKTPEEVAYSRIWDAAANSHLRIGDVTLQTLLCPQGLRIEATAPHVQGDAIRSRSVVVPWTDLRTAVVNPVPAAREKVLRDVAVGEPSC